MSAGTSSLRLNLLGPPQILLADQPVAGFVSRKAQALFIYLAVTQQPYTRDTLAGMFWPDMPEADAKTNLRKALSNLRQLLGPYLTITRHNAAFNAHRDHWIDAVHLAAVLDAAPLDALTGETADRLASVLDLYRGEFLQGFYLKDSLAFSEWVLVWRERLNEQVVQALYTLAQYHTGRQQHSQAIRFLRRLLHIAPWREDAHRQLMLALARTGQFNAALAQYQTCCRVLEEELGIAPLPETTALYERLRALRTSPRHNLPVQARPFIGRRQELETIARLTASPDCRLLTLVGMGGVGKTRLALEAARGQIDRFLDGLYFVPLATVSGREGFIQAVAGAVGLSFHPQGEPWEQVLNYLQARECLLLLDNFEHLHHLADLLGDILSHARQVKIWVTSRRRLNLPWEWTLELTGLDYPPDEADDIEAYDAVQMFLHCARRTRTDFTLGPADRPWLARLCRLLEGLPLGLELAAAWTRALTCAEIYRQVHRGLDSLTASTTHLPDRHRSLAAVLRHAWERLPPEEQKIFARLAVFRAGFDAPAARQVAQSPASLLAVLVDQSFLHMSDSRYSLHELWRQFLLDHLSRQTDEYHQVCRRHSRHYLARLQSAARASELAPDIDNLWAGWQWACEHGPSADVVAYVNGLADFLEQQNRFAELVTLFEQSLAALERLPGDDRPRDALQQAGWVRRLGEACFRLGRLPESKTYHLQALARLDNPMPEKQPALGWGLVRELGRQVWYQVRRPRSGRRAAAHRPADRPLLEAARAFERLGQIYFFAAQPVPALYTSFRGLNLAEAAAPSPELARLYANLGLAVGFVPLHRLARRYIRLAVSTARQIEHQPALAWTLEVGSIYYSGVGDWETAARMAAEAAILNRRLGNIRHRDECLVMLAQKEHFAGRFRQSIEVWREMYMSALQRGDVQVQRWALSGQASNLLPLGRVAEAVDLLELGLALPLKLTDTTTDISHYGLLAAARLRQGQFEAAKQAAETALKLMARSSPTSFSSLEGYAAVAEVWLRLWEREQSTQAQAAARQAVKVLRRFARNFPIARPRAGLWQGLYLQLAGKPGRARAVWQKSRHAARQSGMPYDAALVLVEMSRFLPPDDPARSENLAEAGQIFDRLDAPLPAVPALRPARGPDAPSAAVPG